jgi:hypothetical protein
MKSCKWMLICLFVAAYANANSTDAQTQQAVGSVAISPVPPPTVDSPAQTVPKPGKRGRNQAARGSLSYIKRGVVKEMRATSAFVQQQAANTETLDGWLMALAAFGLIALQLRRKHKSLPQRRITPYG